jgi:hypothetical protein
LETVSGGCRSFDGAGRLGPVVEASTVEKLVENQDRTESRHDQKTTKARRPQTNTKTTTEVTDDAWVPTEE